MNNSDKTYLTAEGLQKLRDELVYLEGEKRKEVAQKLEEALAMGDLSENAAYDEAKDALERLERRIAELKVIIKNAEIIQTDGDVSEVKIGATIAVEKEETKEEKTFTIVGRNEVAPLEGRISNESPLGQAFLGKKKGVTVTVKTPKGDVLYKIKKISFKF